MSSISGFGDEHELRVSRSVASKYAAGRELPKMGFEIIIKKCDSGGHLAIQNISGTFVLASYSHERQQWEEAFGIEMPKFGKPIAADDIPAMRG